MQGGPFLRDGAGEEQEENPEQPPEEPEPELPEEFMFDPEGVVIDPELLAYGTPAPFFSLRYMKIYLEIYFYFKS